MLKIKSNRPNKDEKKNQINIPYIHNEHEKQSKKNIYLRKYYLCNKL